MPSAGAPGFIGCARGKGILARAGNAGFVDGFFQQLSREVVARKACVEGKDANFSMTASVKRIDSNLRCSMGWRSFNDGGVFNDQ